MDCVFDGSKYHGRGREEPPFPQLEVDLEGVPGL